MRRVTQIAAWSGALLCLLVVISFLVSIFIDEYMGRRIEAGINDELQGYRIKLQDCDFNPLRLTIILKNITLIQNAHPDPPVARIDRLQASVHWAAILRTRLVGDIEVDRPDIHIDRVQLKEEPAGKVPIQKRGWQDAINAIFPLKINRFTARNGRFIYVDQNPKRPIFLTEINLKAENIRNVYSPERVYPSQFSFTARVFKKGFADIKGRANFLGEPHLGMEAEIMLQEVELAYFRPIAARYRLAITSGNLSAQGRIEYAPKIRSARLKKLQIDGVKIDYLFTSQSAQNDGKEVEKVAKAAKKVSNKPGLLLRIDDLRLSGEVGFVNKAQSPSYRLFLQKAKLHLTNLSNQFSEGLAEAHLSGHFMGSGQTEILARFRPEHNGPDFDLFARIVGTKVTSLNNLLRAYGDFDVTEGRFSLFSELHVQNKHVEGYVKPFFKDLEVYDPKQDKEKNLFQKLYEVVIEGIAELLKNESSDKIATKADISGQIENPKANTWQVIINLIRNAFFKIILPGFENNLPDNG